MRKRSRHPKRTALSEVPGTASCRHFSVGNVTAASCGSCGPLPIVRHVVTVGKVAR